MKRRAFTGLLASAVAWPSARRAQARKAGLKVGYVIPATKTTAATAAFTDGMRSVSPELRDVEDVLRYTGGDPARIVPTIKDLIESKVTLLVPPGPALLRAAKGIAGTLPIVTYDFETDPVAEGFAQSIAHPGGNVTGIFLDMPTFSGKWMELLVECVPRLSRVALIWDPSTGRIQIDSLTAIATQLGLQFDVLEVRERADFTGAFAGARDRGANAAILLSSPLAYNNLSETAELSLRHRLPTITLFSQFARAGGMLSYGPNLVGAARQAGVLAGKVLMGAAPGNVPIERPTRFELLVNMRTAETFGIKIPAQLQARADEVIE
ncbi:putative ABC transport system substrate-binding protein [Enhydrobacter aerosaccus]|uniref:Putative ABC transport system substrate-binding protein n=1 Tax=Enhydrobacter aerosaccus TaxID=225324 RepID=A0A1T4S848_9HYPH|nr:ABC transporter substrate-binding protein [Enhydrobacter aerosaccus]SKA24500.1 putative ABC transport system substrate-binding protein [Enhydrobacter aerosaccus]